MEAFTEVKHATAKDVPEFTLAIRFSDSLYGVRLLFESAHLYTRKTPW